MSNRDDLIRKIKLLLNLGKSTNPNEAEAAVAKAMLMMDEHDVSQNEMDRSEIRIGRVDLDPIYVQIEHKLIVTLLMEHFRIRAVHSARGRRRAYSFLGDPTNLDIALQVYRTLLSAFRRRWRERQKTLRNPDRVSFMLGIAGGVSGQLKRIREGMSSDRRNALVAIDAKLDRDVDDYFNRRGVFLGEHKTIRRQGKDRFSVLAGYAEGLTIQINQRVEMPTAQPLQIGHE